MAVFNDKEVKNFMDKINKKGQQILEEPCWEWTRFCKDGLSPETSLPSRLYRPRRKIYAQRFAWGIYYGELPGGEFNVYRRCDNKLCVRKEHLYLSTNPRKVKEVKITNLKTRNFWKKVIKGLEEDDCWSWSGFKDESGYGRNGDGVMHRYSFALAGNTFTSGDMVLHRCDNPECTNPKHLYLGDAAQNIQDMMDRGRTRYHI